MILKVIVVVCVCAIIGLVAFQFVDPNLDLGAGGGSTTIVDDKTSITIGVTGEVSSPGDYVFTEDKPTMEDLLGASGGINTNGDNRCFNLEAVLEANSSYYIPPKYDNSDICSNEPISKISINDGTKEELLTVNGFGDAISTSIIQYREANGVFYTLEALMNVSGIGYAKFNMCKNYIILHD